MGLSAGSWAWWWMVCVHSAGGWLGDGITYSYPIRLSSGDQYR